VRLSLTPLQRTSLLTFSGLTYGLAFLTNAGALRAQPAPSSLRIAATPGHAAIVVAASIRRDPFAATPAPQRIVHSADGVRVASGGPGFAPVPAGLSVPSIDGLTESAAEPTRTLALKATIAGPEPVAYVEDGQTLQIVRPGDAIAGLRVRSIDLHGVVFDDGTQLELPERSSPPTAPAHRATAARVVAQPTASAAASAAQSPSPSATSIAAEPTPGPLPTPRAGAYPLGARPTSDPAAPTAFPYPYPYAPH